MNKTVLNQAVIKMLKQHDEVGIKTPSERERQSALLECSVQEDGESLTIWHMKHQRKTVWIIKETLLGNAKLVGFFEEDHWSNDYLAVSITFAMYLHKRHGIDKVKLSALGWEELVAMITLDVHGVAMKQPIQDWLETEKPHFWTHLKKAKFHSGT